MHIFHKYNKWEHYKEEGDCYVSDRFGTTILRQYIETRRKRSCEICGHIQDQQVSFETRDLSKKDE